MIYLLDMLSVVLSCWCCLDLLTGVEWAAAAAEARRGDRRFFFTD